MALLIGCLALFLAAGYWLMGRVDAFLARSVVCEAVSYTHLTLPTTERV